MVRLSKQKQEKLEHIMSLVEHLGIDRVLVKLRQTKMMSKDVLDDMKEWETDYEKRVALLGFLVSPEGKRAFGALFELAKVHEEQLKLQEEQEKLKQEQLAQQAGNGRGGKVQGSMKNKLRAQMAKRRPTQQTQQSKTNEPAPTTSSNNTEKDNIIAPLQITPVGKLEKKPPPAPEIKKIPPKEIPSSSEAPNKLKPDEKKIKKESEVIPKTANKSDLNGDSHKEETVAPISVIKISEEDYGNKDLPYENNIETLESSKSTPPPHEYYNGSPSVRRQNIAIHSKALDDFSSAKHSRQSTSSEGQWVQQDHVLEDDSFSAEVRPSPEGEDAEENKPVTIESAAESQCDKQDRINSGLSKKSSESKEPDQCESPAPESPLKIKLNEIYTSLSKGDLTIDQLTVDDIKDIIGDWQSMRKESQKEREAAIKEILHVKEELRKAVEEKDKIRKEKDKYVFKEFELNQKFQDLSTKHRTLREDHEILRQGNHQQQQSTKKNNKIHQDLRKKISRLENKLKSMDKLTAKKATQTQEIYEKDVYEAKRVAEESLSVAQSELKELAAKLKTLQLENEELKKQINAKGREINKRERKSRKDEENIRLVSRERDSLENKLKKVTEQLEYYRGMLDIRSKGTKRPPEKKEVRVQRCSSGRHILVKTTNGGSNHHHHHEEPAHEETNTRRSSQSLVSNNSSASKPSRPGAATVRGQANKKAYVPGSVTEKRSDSNVNDQMPIQGILKSSNSKPRDISGTKQSESSKQSPTQKSKVDTVNTATMNGKVSQKSKVTIRETSEVIEKNTAKTTARVVSKSNPNLTTDAVISPRDNKQVPAIKTTPLNKTIASNLNDQKVPNGTHASSHQQNGISSTVKGEEKSVVNKPRPVVFASSIKKSHASHNNS